MTLVLISAAYHEKTDSVIGKLADIFVAPWVALSIRPCAHASKVADSTSSSSDLNSLAVAYTNNDKYPILIDTSHPTRAPH